MPQIPRFCPGCAQRKLQMNESPCELCGRVNAVAAPKSREEMHPLARMMRALLQPLGWRVHALTGVFFALGVWAMTRHWMIESFGAEFFSLLLLGLLLTFIHFIRLATRGAVWLFAPATRQTRRPGARTFLFLPACVAALAALNYFDVPLRMGFWLSRPALDRLVQRAYPVLVFTPPSGPRIGLYRVKNFDTDGKNQRFEVAEDSFIYDGTKAGFAKCPQGCGAARFQPIYPYANQPARYTRLSKDWFWWEQAGNYDN